jgi:hypothetical protein
MATVTIRQFVNDLDRVIQQTSVSLAMKLGKGQCGDMKQYNRAVGRMEGMEATVKSARDMLAQMEEADQQSDLPEMPEIPKANKKTPRKKSAGGKK